MRAVLDPNVIISSLLSRHGPPARVVRAWRDGAYELVVSPLLLEELQRALGYRQLRARISEAESRDMIEDLRRLPNLVEDPTDTPPVRSSDPGDDYLIALAAASSAVIVSGDVHLLSMAKQIPVYTSTAFLEFIGE